MTRSILAYGASAGLLIAVLRFIDYRFLVIEHSIEIYGALIAALFATVGIWFGLKLTKEKIVVKHVEVAVPAAPFVFNHANAEELTLTPREVEVLGLMITFGRAFGVGMLITLISCVFYVVAWEIEYATVFSDFADRYAAYAMEEARASGASEATMAEKAAEMADMKRMMDSPVIRPLVVFIEPFPVGVLVTLISAAVLRKK